MLNKIKTTKQNLGLIGSIILFIGVFSPMMSVPIMGNIDYFRNGSHDGVIVLILAIISLVLAGLKKYKGLWFTGIGSYAVLLFTFIEVQLKFSEVKSDMNSELDQNPFAGMAEMMMQSIQFKWGWIVLIVGATMIVASAATKDRTQENK